jgi:hypothetical protein
MVEFSLCFIRKKHLQKYQIRYVKYDFKEDKFYIKLTHYFEEFPGIYITAKRFKFTTVVSVTLDTINVGHQISVGAKALLKTLVKSITDDIKTIL